MTLDKYRLIGARLRAKAPSVYRGHPEMKKWEIVSKTFGFFQWKTKNKITDEQLAAVEDGFKNYAAVKRRKPKVKQAVGPVEFENAELGDEG